MSPNVWISADNMDYLVLVYILIGVLAFTTSLVALLSASVCKMIRRNSCNCTGNLFIYCVCRGQWVLCAISGFNSVLYILYLQRSLQLTLLQMPRWEFTCTSTTIKYPICYDIMVIYTLLTGLPRWRQYPLRCFSWNPGQQIKKGDKKHQQSVCVLQHQATEQHMIHQYSVSYFHY